MEVRMAIYFVLANAKLNLLSKDWQNVNVSNTAFFLVVVSDD
jgi:hypothetical protein